MANVNPEQLEEIFIDERYNERKCKELYIKGKHVSLQTLRERMLQVRPQDPMIKYISKKIPPYPAPVEFWVSDVAHVTEESGFKGIIESEQFRPPNSKFSWWDLKINKEEIKAAEMRYMESKSSNQAEDQKEQEPFLETFTTSPVFTPEKSRYGNYRFTFPLTDLIRWYKEQNCEGKEPVIRVYKTIIYIQEIVYAVLIHSPDENQQFNEYPLLEVSEWVKYQVGKIIWKAQAICETHNFEFHSGKVKGLNTHEFYVWDQVSLVFHLPNSKGIKIPRDGLIEAFEACELAEKDLSGYKGRFGGGTKTSQERFLEANSKVGELKKELESKKNEKETLEDSDIKMAEDD